MTQPAYAPLPAFDILMAIHEVENPRDLQTPGAHGELGPHQLTCDTWRRYTLLPFTPQYVCDPKIEEVVALKHLRWIESELKKAGVVPTVFRVAVAWNGGIEPAVTLWMEPSTADYAKRVVNLVKLMEDSR